jgi:YfiH family protein
MEWRERDGVRWLETPLGDRGRVAFGTRVGGVSAAPFDSLNLGVLTDDDRVAVIENRGRLAAALDTRPDRIACARQVHGAELEHHTAAEPNVRGSLSTRYVGKEPRDREVGEADGQVMAAPGLAGLVFTADCLPVALAGPGGVTMLHCGWRGLAAGIVAKGAAAVCATDAAIGPGIGRCCYEVGDEVRGAFAELGEGIADGRMLDLAEVARCLLASAGVERTEVAGLCTSCERSLFFSHRRDAGQTGRQGSLAWIEDEEA